MTTFAGRAVWPQPFMDRRGNARAGLVVTVYEAGTTNSATLYTDRTKATELPSNSTITDAEGNLWLFLDPGDYDALIDGETFPFTVVPEAGDVATGVFVEVADSSINVTAPPVDVDPAIGDDSTDNRAALLDQVAAFQWLWLPSGTFQTSKYVPVSARTDLNVTGRSGVVSYPSSDASVVDDGTTASDAEARSAFSVMGGVRVTFDGMVFEGDDVVVDISQNLGHGVYARESTDVRLLGCTSLYGGGLITQDANATDLGLRVVASTTYASRNALNPGLDAVIALSRWEQPTAVGYDRSGNNGSSHAIYAYAGRQNLVALGNVFRNIRTSAIKASGTSAAITNVIAGLNAMWECGNGFNFGDDGNGSGHANAVFGLNALYNPTTKRVGWSHDAAVSILGSRNVSLLGNVYYYDRDAGAGLVSGIVGISILRYTSTSAPVESVSVSEQMFFSSLGAGGASAPGDVVNRAIHVANVGEGSTSHHGACRIANNVVVSTGTVGLYAFRNVCPVIEHNIFSNCPTPMLIEGCRRPIIRFNTTVAGPNSSSNAQLLLKNCSWPIVYGNQSAGRFGTTPGQSFAVSDANGSGLVDHPLLGATGRAKPTMGQPEMVMAYGEPTAWTDGDTIDLNGTTYTFHASSPGAGQFNSFASLVTLMDAHASFTAVDYGADYSPAVATNHIRIRWSVALLGEPYMAVTCANPTAGLVLSNATGGSPQYLNGMGGAASSPGTLMVVWSPLATNNATLSVVPDNAAARTMLLTNGPPIVTNRGGNDSGTAFVVDIGPGAIGTEVFRWSIVA